MGDHVVLESRIPARAEDAIRGEGPPLRPTPPPLLRSRDMAARRLAGGAAGVAVGLAAIGAAFLVGAGPTAFTLLTGGLAVAALGGVRMSLLSSHVWRFGRRRSLRVPLAAGGFGLSAGAAVLAVVAGINGVGRAVLDDLLLAGLVGAASLGVLVAVLTMGALVRWLRGT